LMNAGHPVIFLGRCFQTGPAAFHARHGKFFWEPS
jgi:hypothetical protein